MELVLFNAVVEPVETHVNGLGAILPDGGVHDAIGSAAVGLDGSWRLWMTKLL